MNQTTNYQLSQWEASDRILMSDFNNDNAKIDAALKTQAEAISALGAQLDAKADQDDLTALANRSRFTKLKEVNVAANTSIFELDLSDITWSQWDKVHVDIISVNMDPVRLYYNTNGNSQPNLTLGGISGTHHRPRMTFLVGNDPQRWVTVQWGSTAKETNLMFSALQKLVFGDGVLEAGTAFTVWGEK